jgi:alcohol dehydrogenase
VEKKLRRKYMLTNFGTVVPVMMGSGSSLRTGATLAQKGYKKAFVVFDKGLKENGIVPAIIENIKSAGIETVEYDNVLPDPPDSTVEAGAELARKAACDVIVGIGGGSSIDTAKGINVLMNNPPPIRQYFGYQPGLKPGVPLVFIPTTSGTGSEVTNMCVISVPSESYKKSVLSPVCVSSLAILDPDLTLGLPPGLTAATGLDALAHATESLTGSQQNPLSDGLARDAIRTIYKWLPVAVADGKNLEARERLQVASLMAGMAFTNALVHLGHCIGHNVGAQFHVPHGIACAVCLPEVIEWTAETQSKKVRMICEALDVQVPDNASPQEIGRLAKNAIRALSKKVNIPNLEALKIPKDALEKLADATIKEGAIAFCPAKISKERIIQLMNDAYSA